MTGHPIPDAALNAHIAILGKTGGGKSYTARGLVERLLRAERRVCILDPVGVWWGLRSNFAGDGPGFAIAVLGGVEGDMPLVEGMAGPLAEIVATRNVPMVIDYSDMGVGERNRFMTAFLGDLYAKKARNKQALWLVLEEVDEIAPQQVRPEGARLLDAVDKIARRGRSRGFRLISISQRPQVINKNVLTQTQTMVAHRLTAPLDRKAVGDWIKAGAEDGKGAAIMDGLPGLETGEAWVWAQDQGILERSTMPKIQTFDSSATPDADEEASHPTKLADVDVSALRAAIETQEPEPDEAKRAPDKAAIKAAEARGHDRGYQAGYSAGRQDGVSEGVAQENARILAAIGAVAPMPDRGGQVPIAQPKPMQSAPPKASIRPQSSNPPQAAIRMLEKLNTNPPVRMSWNALAASIGNKARGGHFNTTRKWLIESGRVVEQNGLVSIAEPSANAGPPMDDNERAEFLRTQWRAILGGRAAQIIDLLETGRSLTKFEAAAALGCAAHGGHWNSAWKSLRDNELVTEAAGRWSLTAELLAPPNTSKETNDNG